MIFYYDFAMIKITDRLVTKLKNMGIFNRFRITGKETGPKQTGIEDKFSRDEVSRNVAENMPPNELMELIRKQKELLKYEEEHNEADNEIVEHHRQQLQMLEEVLASRTKKE